MSPSLKSIVEDSKSAKPDPLVVPLHTQWLTLPEDQQVYSEEAIAFVGDAMRGKFKHPRNGRFSPSSLGYCKRRQALGFAGAPQLGEDPDQYDLMGLGTWGHLRWQAEGLSYPFDNPYMKEAERWVHDREMRLGGSIDAILYDGSIFELKTSFFTVFNKVLTTGVAKWEHRMQFAAYRALTAIDAASLIYEERGTGNYFELRLEGHDPEAEDAAAEEVEELNVHVDNGTLPKMLEPCEQRTGSVYKACPFRKICPRVHDIASAEASGVAA